MKGMRAFVRVVCVVLGAVPLASLPACNEFDLTIQEEEERPLEAPVAEILSPSFGAVFNHVYTFPLMGSVEDAEDLEQTLLATWSSDLDGEIASPTPTPTGGVQVDEPVLSVGLHTVTLTVTDSDEMEGSDSVDIEVCGVEDEGHLQLQSGGHAWTRIVAGEADAVNELYLIEPDLQVISLDVAEEQLVLKDLGYYEACTQLVFRLVTSIGNETYDSDVDGNFVIDPIQPNFWHVNVEDGADNDFNDILLDVWGGVPEGDMPPGFGDEEPPPPE